MESRDSAAIVLAAGTQQDKKYRWLFREQPRTQVKDSSHLRVLAPFDDQVKQARKLYLAGNMEEASRLYRAAIDHFEALIADVPPGDPLLQEMSLRMGIFEEWTSKILGPVERDPKPDLSAKIFHLMEERRVCLRTLTLKKCDVTEYFDVAAGLLKEENDILASRFRIETFGQKDKGIGQWAALSTRLKRVRMTMRDSSARFAALINGGPTTLSDLQAGFLADDEVLMDFNLFRDRLVVGIITKDRANYHQFSVSRTDIEKAVFQFQDKLREYTAGGKASFMGHAWREMARRLHRLVLGPLPRLPQGKKIVLVIPDRAIWYLPLSLLLDAEDRPFGRNRLVTFVASGGMLTFREMSSWKKGQSRDRADLVLFESIPWVEARDSGRRKRGKRSRDRLKKDLTEGERIERLILTNPVYPRASEVVHSIREAFPNLKSWTGPEATIDRWEQLEMGGRLATILAVPLAVTDKVRENRQPSYFFSAGNDESERRFEAKRLFNTPLGSDFLIMPTAWYELDGRASALGEGPLLLSTAMFYVGVRMGMLNYSAPQWGDEAPFLMSILGAVGKGTPIDKALTAYPRSMPTGFDSSFSGRPPAWAGWILMGVPR